MKNISPVSAITVIAVVIIVCITVLGVFSSIANSSAVSVVTGVITQIVGFGGLIITGLIALMSSARNTQARENSEVLVNNKLDVIHENTNSSLAEIKAELKALQAKYDAIIQAQGKQI